MFKKEKRECNHRVLVLEYRYSDHDTYICIACEARITYSTVKSVTVVEA